MKIYITTLFILINVFQLAAQYQVDWMRTFQNNAASAYNRGEDIIADNGLIIVTGIIDTLSTVGSVTIAYDSSGNQLWRSSPPGIQLAFSWRAFKMPWQRYMVAGHYEDQTGTNNMFYIEYNQNGDSITGAVLNAPGFATGDDLGDAAVDIHGSVYLAGMINNAGNFEAAVARYDSGGVFRWLSSYPNPVSWMNAGFVRGLELSGDTAMFLWTFNMSGEGALLKYDTAGAFIWIHEPGLRINTYHSSLATDRFGNAIIGGNLNNSFGLIKYYSTGDTAWTRSFQYPGLSPVTGAVLNVQCDSVGNIFVFGTGNNAGPYGLVAAFDSSGIMQWADTVRGYGTMAGYNREQFNLANGIVTLSTVYAKSWLYQWDMNGNRITDAELILSPLINPEVNGIYSDNGILYLTGSSNNGSGSREGFTAKLTNTTAGITHITSGKKGWYPNPAMDLLFFDTEEKVHSVIYDLTGSEMVSADGNVIDIRNLSSGLYIIVTTNLKNEINRNTFIKL
jgi:hypothetical protein